jgi:hypothetical protein
MGDHPEIQRGMKLHSGGGPVEFFTASRRLEKSQVRVGTFMMAAGGVVQRGRDEEPEVDEVLKSVAPSLGDTAQRIAVTGTAMRMKIELAAAVRELGLVPSPFTPIPQGPVVDHNITLEGYAAPATVDREFMKFAATCWTPFKPDIPVLYRHQSDQPAGRIDLVRVDEKGLYVRARVSHAEAKRCPYFSVAATVHAYRIVQANDRERVHGLITSATLDEVSLVPSSPGNPDALAQRAPAVAESYDIVKDGILKAIEIVEALKIYAQSPRPEPPPRRREKPMQVDPHRATSFGRLIDAIEARSSP